jgi:hypothetical protein
MQSNKIAITACNGIGTRPHQRGFIMKALAVVNCAGAAPSPTQQSHSKWMKNISEHDVTTRDEGTKNSEFAQMLKLCTHPAITPPAQWQLS